MIHCLEIGIRRAYVSKAFWEILDEFGAGPFDGACLICAKAIKTTISEGEIVRIVDVFTGITQHYGLEVNGTIYDFDGACDSITWTKRFQRNEGSPNTEYKVTQGIDERSEIPEDDQVSDLLTDIIVSLMGSEWKASVSQKLQKTT